MNYFDTQITLLQQEKEYDRLQHEQLLLHSSLQERKMQGVSWYPIMISNTSVGRGDYLTVTVNKTNLVEEGHKFRFGMPVALFSNYDSNSDRLNGIIDFVNRDTMRISFRVDELPDWTRSGKLGVDLLFDEYSYKEMFAALEQAKLKSAEKKEGNIVRQLLGEEEIHIDKKQLDLYNNDDLNFSQNLAVNNMLADRVLTLLHGPPGTGKTTTLIYGIASLLKAKKKQILVVAPSNTAVDLLAERLSTVGLSVIRVGNPVRVSEKLQDLTLDASIDKHRANKERKELEKQARAYLNLAHKYKRNFGKAEREQRKALFDEVKKIQREIDKIQDYIVEDVLEKVDVIVTTLVGANSISIRDRQYDTVVIDEAAQALEPACWIPILKAKKIILAGDHYQLPPTVKSTTNSTEGLYVTLFEKLVNRFPNSVCLLDTQYRMHQNIMKYPSKIFYDTKLIAAELVSSHTIEGDNEPVLFIDTAGSGYEETIDDSAISNDEEAHFLYRHLKENVLDLKERFKDIPSIGVIAPYRQQSNLLKELIYQDEILNVIKPKIQVHTIDSFQGQEQDIVYISLTRSNSGQQIGFLSDIRRMNVAMTRARKKLIVIGDSATIGQHDFYKGFLDYIQSLNSYHSVWEWMD